MNTQEHPPIPNRSESIVLIGQNMLKFFDVLNKYDEAAEKVIKNPTEKNVARYHELDEIVRNLLQIIPELDNKSD